MNDRITDNINILISDIVNVLHFKNFILSQSINESKESDPSTQKSIKIINKVIRIKMNELLSCFEKLSIDHDMTADDWMATTELLGQYSEPVTEE